MNKKLSVLFLCGWYPSRVLPYNGDFIQRHAEAVSLKHDVSIIHIISDKNCKKNIEIESKIINGIQTHIAYLKPLSNTIYKNFMFYKAYKLLLNKVNYFDIIHLNEVYPFGVFCLYAKFFQKRKYIISEHFTGYLSFSKTKINYFHQQISKLIIKKASVVCTVSDYQKKDLIASGYKGNYETVGNIVDTKLFIPKKKETDFLKLLHVSSLKDNHKNIKGMLQVAKLLDNKLNYFEWKFIGGDGSEYEDFIRELDFKNATISFFNQQSHLEMIHHLQEASICISFSNYETFGIVIAESIACGTPVIATNTGIASDFETLPFCKVIDVNDKELLYSSILNYKTIFADLNTNYMHTFIKSKFSKKAISDKFSSIYHKSIKS